MNTLAFLIVAVVAAQAPEVVPDLTALEGVDSLKEPLALAAAAAAIIRLVLWLANKKLPFIGVLMERIPKDARVLVALGLAGLAGALEHFTEGGTLLSAIVVFSGAFIVSETTFRAQRGREKRLATKAAAAASASLGRKG